MVDSLPTTAAKLGWPAVAAMLLIVPCGCGQAKNYPVRGEVIVVETGRLSEGEIRFRSISNRSLVVSGKIHKEGKFSLSLPDGTGLPEGSYRAAVIAEPKKGKRLVHERYEDFDTSDLQFTVTAREENYFFVEVRRSGK